MRDNTRDTYEDTDKSYEGESKSHNDEDEEKTNKEDCYVEMIQGYHPRLLRWKTLMRQQFNMK